AEICIGILDSYGVIRIPDEYVLVDFYGFIVIAVFDKTSGIIPDRLNFRNIFVGHSLS
ncbi:MAG TPA: hypothetical protein G4N93_06440, partial [Dehalococcoidia bacterium]|nr:hypothetical protein [Dehalococcoidia bacterium]